MLVFVFDTYKEDTHLSGEVSHLHFLFYFYFYLKFHSLYFSLMVFVCNLIERSRFHHIHLMAQVFVAYKGTLS